MFVPNEKMIGKKVALTSGYWTEKGYYTKGHIMRVKSAESGGCLAGGVFTLEDENGELCIMMNHFIVLDEFLVEETMPEELYLILLLGEITSNCAIWWRPNHRGYTVDIDKAGRYTKEQADKIRRNRPQKDVPILWSKVEPLILKHVHFDKVAGLAPPNLRDVSE